MPHITLTPFTASYQYNDTLIQQTNNGVLLLSHRIRSSFTSQYILTFTLMAPSIDFSFCELDSVILELPIQRVCFYHYPLYNKVIVRSNSTTTSERLEVEISPSSFYNGFLNLDITTLLRDWNPNQTATYKMTVSLANPDLSIKIKHQSAIFPRIHIEYHTLLKNKFAPDTTNTDTTNIDHIALHKTYPDNTKNNSTNTYITIPYSNNPNSTPPNSTTPSYIEVCSVSKNNCFIDAAGIFLFNSIDSASNISYSLDTGLFSFSSTGIYYVNWMLFLRGTGSINWIKIGLKNHTTGEILLFNSPCVIPGQICGQHILHVKNLSSQYSLINDCESTIQLCSNNTTNASLIIYKL